MPKNALTTMIAGETGLQSDSSSRERIGLPPCGGCMDWIMSLGKRRYRSFSRCSWWQFHIYAAKDLMPYYPNSRFEWLLTHGDADAERVESA